MVIVTLFATVIKKTTLVQLNFITKRSYFQKSLNSEFSYIEVWLTGQISKPLEIENNISITLVIN